LKTLIIGDIHGCYQEFLELLDKTGVSNEDKIIALGDIIDRGPDSMSVINFFISHHNALCILGNHEAKHIQVFSGKIKPAPSQQKVLQQISVTAQENIVNYFEKLPLYIELPEIIALHGYLEPGVALEKQQKRVLIGATSGELLMKKKYPEPWYQYEHGNKPIIAGHFDYSGKGKPLIINDKIYLIDTGCCYGKNLTGLLLPEFKLFSVKSRENYWGKAMQGYKKRNNYQV